MPPWSLLKYNFPTRRYLCSAIQLLLSKFIVCCVVGAHYNTKVSRKPLALYGTVVLDGHCFVLRLSKQRGWHEMWRMLLAEQQQNAWSWGSQNQGLVIETRPRVFAVEQSDLEKKCFCIPINEFDTATIFFVCQVTKYVFLATTYQRFEQADSILQVCRKYNACLLLLSRYNPQVWD